VSVNIFFHFSVVGFSNTYLVAGEGSDALLIDPGHMDLGLLNKIESRGYYIRYILLTHRHKGHTQGLGTLLKIYDSELFAYTPYGYGDYQITPVADGDQLNLSGMKIDCIHVPGHTSDSLVYKIDQALFTGDVLMAGRLGTCESKLHHSLLLRSINEKLLGLDDSHLILPGHGAPSSIGIEKLFNQEIIDYQRHEAGEE
jgi:glyoxylase-like metal-dependent hydrolase (beta-lactamase superfamily II)